MTDLMTQQIALEERMASLGVEKFRAAHQDSLSEGAATDTLGGTYSVQSVDLQLPLAKVQIKNLERAGSLPELPEQVATPKVVTGMDALGRGNDLSNLMQFLSLVGETPAAQRLKWDQIATRVANGLNVETDAQGSARPPSMNVGDPSRGSLVGLCGRNGILCGKLFIFPMSRRTR